MKRKTRFFTLTAFIFLLVLFLLMPVLVFGADNGTTPPSAPGFLDMLSRPAALVNYVVNVLVYLLAQLASWVFSFAGFFVNTALDLNAKVSQTALAQTGWTITRDIANLGFVLVIVIIAVMTILRFEQYGVKKLLPKLIAAAIIVNFSFMIATTVIDFTNVLTNFFYSRVASNNFGVTTNLAGAFNPQTFSAPPAQNAYSIIQEGENLTTTLGSSVLRLVFIIVFTLAGALALFTLALMLLIRYLHLIFLLIIAPIVWLFWVFPGLGGEFSRWWKSFFRWSFFAPASAFFLYLALTSVGKMRTAVGDTAQNPGYGSDPIMFILNQGAQMIVLVGIMLGGIIIANEMGITGAAGALGLAKRIGGNVTAWASRQGVRYGTAAFRTKPATAVTDWMQKRSVIPGFRALKSVLVAPIGTALNRAAAAGERLPEDAGKKWAGLSDQRMAAAFDTMNYPEQIYALNRLRKNNTLDKLGPMNQLQDRLINGNYKRRFEKFGNGKEFNDLEKATGVNVETMDAIRNNNMGLAKELSENFFATFKPEDFAKMQTNEIFKSPDEKKASPEEKRIAALTREIVIHGMAMKNTGGIARLLKDAKGTTIDNVINATNNVQTDLLTQAYSLPSGSPEADELHDIAIAIDEVRKNTLASRKMGLFSAWTMEAGASPAAPGLPAAPPPPKPTP